MITLYTTERAYSYGVLRSTNASKVKVVLEEKGLDYSIVNLPPGDLWKKPPDMLRKHPLGKVPYLDDGDYTIYDSTVINEYLNEAYPDPGLMPTAPVLRAQVRMLENFADEAILTGYLPLIWLSWWTSEEKRDQKSMAHGRDELRSKVLPYIEDVLKATHDQIDGEAYLCGDFSLADPPYMAMAMVFEVDGFDLSDFPWVHAYLERLRARPSYRAISPATPLPD